MLASGRGSNLQALLDAIAAGQLDAQIVGVFSDKPQAAALQRVAPALRWSADAEAYSARARPSMPTSPMRSMACGRTGSSAPATCASSAMPSSTRFRGRLLNIHPSLLPAYPGLRTHARAIADGEREHGASVHFVIPELDAGAVIAQARVPVLPGDDARRAGRRACWPSNTRCWSRCSAWPSPAAWLNAAQPSPSTVIRCLRPCA